MTQSEIRKLSNELSSLLKSFAIHLNVGPVAYVKVSFVDGALRAIYTLFCQLCHFIAVKILLKIRVFRLEIRFHFFPI